MKRLQRIGIALQGGGTHGAFAWGVLDRLLDEVKAGCFEMAAVSIKLCLVIRIQFQNIIA